MVFTLSVLGAEDEQTKVRRGGERVKDFCEFHRVVCGGRGGEAKGLAGAGAGGGKGAGT